MTYAEDLLRMQATDAELFDELSKLTAGELAIRTDKVGGEYAYYYSDEDRTSWLADFPDRKQAVGWYVYDGGNEEEDEPYPTEQAAWLSACFWAEYDRKLEQLATDAGNRLARAVKAYLVRGQVDASLFTVGTLAWHLSQVPSELNEQPIACLDGDQNLIGELCSLEAASRLSGDEEALSEVASFAAEYNEQPDARLGFVWVRL